jgi:DNA-binding SARP family transcriptional activator
MKMLHMVTLGGFTLFDSGGVPVAFPTRKQMALLAYLAVHPDKVFLRGALAPMFWGDDDEARSRHSLSQALYNLKRVVGSTWSARAVRWSGSGKTLSPSTHWN